MRTLETLTGPGRDINKHRVRQGPMASDDSIGRNGAFIIQTAPKVRAICVVSDGEHDNWEHVSVHMRYKNAAGKVQMRTPSWDEMCFVKDFWFEDEELVLQFHPPKSEYVNNHKHVLHLWRDRRDGATVMPPKEAV